MSNYLYYTTNEETPPPPEWLEDVIDKASQCYETTFRIVHSVHREEGEEGWVVLLAPGYEETDGGELIFDGGVSYDLDDLVFHVFSKVAAIVFELHNLGHHTISISGIAGRHPVQFEIGLTPSSHGPEFDEEVARPLARRRAGGETT